MKKLLLILTTLFISVIGYSQNVNIPDANFKTYLIGNSSINTNGDSEIQVSEATAFSGAIYSSNLSISDLTGIEAFTNLTTLRCHDNSLTTLDISNNTNLIELGCNNNALATLDLTNNTNLTELRCGNNTLTSLDVSNNNALTHIDCGSNPIMSIDVSNHPNLNFLGCNFNSTLTSLDVSNNTVLTEIYCNNTPITALNVANGNNTNFTTFAATNTPNLTCIEVDDINYSITNWTNIDATVSFSTDCVSLQVGDTFVDNFITYEITSIGPNTVKTIGYDSSGGTDVNIPATVSNNGTVFNVIEIGGSSFVGQGLTSVIIPDSVITIGLYAFFINSLTSVTIPSGITVIEQGVFEDNSLTSIIIPNGVTAIGISAFKSNSLTNIVIPSNVTSIGLQAFTNNPLVNVTSENNMPPTITTGGPDDSFSSNRSGIDLIIPIGTTGVYVTDSGALWTGFNSVTEDASLSTSDFELANAINILNTKDELKVISNGSARLEEYTIYSISGVKMKEGTESTIAIDAISNGIYIIELNFNKGRLAKKFVK